MNKMVNFGRLVSSAACLAFALPLPVFSAIPESGVVTPTGGTDPTTELNTIPLSDPASASQWREPSDDTARGHSRLIEEIIVTAQKREENLQSVPISISAFTGDALEARGIENAVDLSQATPGMVYSSLVGYSLIYIRGEPPRLSRRLVGVSHAALAYSGICE